MTLALGLTVAALLPLVAMAAPEVTATGTLLDREIPFYRVTRYVVRVEAPEGSEVTVSLWEEPLPGLTATREDPSITSLASGGMLFEQDIVLAPVEPRQYTLPPVPVLVDGATVATLEPGALAVRSLTQEEVADLSAPEPLLTLDDLADDSLGWPSYLLLGAFVVVVFLLAGLAGFGYRGPRPQRVRALGPLAEALDALATLENHVAQGEVRCVEVHLRLSLIVQNYLERSLGLHVRELSTPEIASGPLAALPITRELSERVIGLLVAADRVKYAQDDPSRDAQLTSIQAARDVMVALDRPDPSALTNQGAA